MRGQVFLLVTLSFVGSCVNDCGKKTTMSQEIIGKKLPNIVLASSGGGEVRIPEDLLRFYTVLFFYPKDDTPGCTKEACTFRDNLLQFKSVNAKIFGVSSDGIESHHKFIAKHGLNFPLLADEGKQLASALDVSSTMGMFSRDTFLIDPKGHIAMVWRKVDATNTVFDTLKKLSELNSQEMPAPSH